MGRGPRPRVRGPRRPTWLTRAFRLPESLRHASAPAFILYPTGSRPGRPGRGHAGGVALIRRGDPSGLGRRGAARGATALHGGAVGGGEGPRARGLMAPTGGLTGPRGARGQHNYDPCPHDPTPHGAPVGPGEPPAAPQPTPIGHISAPCPPFPPLGGGRGAPGGRTTPQASAAATAGVDARRLADGPSDRLGPARPVAAAAGGEGRRQHGPAHLPAGAAPR